MPFIENKLKASLHKKREFFITKAINELIAERNPPPETIAIFRKKLNDEADRVYAIVDKSILKSRLKTAKWTFWISVIASVIVIGVIAAFTGGTAILFVAPVCAAFVAWLMNVVTIPINYNQRVASGMDTILISMRKELDSPTTEFDINHYQNELTNIKTTLVTVIKKLNTQSQQNTAMIAPRSIQQELSDIKITLNSLFAKVNDLNQKVDYLYELQTRTNFNNSLPQASSNDPMQTTITQLMQLLFSSSMGSMANIPITNLNFFNKPTLPVMYQAKKTFPAYQHEPEPHSTLQRFFNPGSSMPILKSIEFNQIEQFKRQIEDTQRIYKKPILKIIAMYTTEDGWTLLHYATQCNSAAIVNYLLNLGVNPEAKTNKGLSALDIAIKNANKEIIIPLAKRSNLPSNDTYMASSQQNFYLP